jgi:diguanylate cyclase (GGDEF)-like protein
MMALLYLDLDRFKRINDNLGHSVGDALLQNVARGWSRASADRASYRHGRAAAQRPEVRVARLGGDEFVVLLTDVADEEQIVAVAERIRSRWPNRSTAAVIAWW